MPRTKKLKTRKPRRITFTFACIDCGSPWLYFKRGGRKKCPICGGKMEENHAKG